MPPEIAKSEGDRRREFRQSKWKKKKVGKQENNKPYKSYWLGKLGPASKVRRIDPATGNVIEDAPPAK